MYPNWQTVLFIVLLVTVIISINLILFITKKNIGRIFCLTISSLFVGLEIFKIFYQIFVKNQINIPNLWAPFYICSFNLIFLFSYSLFYKKQIGNYFLAAYLTTGVFLIIIMAIAPDATNDQFFSKVFSGGKMYNLFFTIYSLIFHTSFCIIFFIVFFNLPITLTFRKNYLGGLVITVSLFCLFILTTIAKIGLNLKNWDWDYFYQPPIDSFQGIYDKLGNASGIIIFCVYCVTFWGLLAGLIYLRSLLFRLSIFKKHLNLK